MHVDDTIMLGTDKNAVQDAMESYADAVTKIGMQVGSITYDSAVECFIGLHPADSGVARLPPG